MNDAHRLVYDSRGWFCLNCPWPGDEFTHLREDALEHKEASRVRGAK